MRKPLDTLPNGPSTRAIQLDLFLPLPDFSDVALRDYQETMQRPFFSLAKSRRIKPIDYTSRDGKVSVQVSANPVYGMATIWDADILIFLASAVQDQIRQGKNEIKQTIQIHPGHLLRRIGRTCAGRDYERLVAALGRLQSTTIKTNIRSGKRRETVFSWIDSFTHLIDENSGKSLGMEITMSRWFYEGVIESANVLSINPEYFSISGGLERVLYRIGRKHAGGHGRDGFVINLTTLHEKTGSESPFKRFKFEIGKIIDANDLPDIHLEHAGSSVNPQIRMVMRDKLGDTAAAPAAGQGAVTRSAKPRPAPANPDDEIEDEILALIREECPGWDLDVMRQQFDSHIGRDPKNLPANYGRRFLAFMRVHHQRSGRTLGDR